MRGKGSKYESTKGLKHTEIAKLVRKDLAAAVKAGDFPAGTKFSVRATWATHSPAIDINITVLPGVSLWQRDDAGELVATHDDRVYVQRAEAVLQAYNYDKSDPMTDYFDVRFYGHAAIGNELKYGERERLQAEAGDERARLGLMIAEAGGYVWLGGNVEEAAVQDAIIYLDACREGRGAEMQRPYLLARAWRTKAQRKKAERYGVPV